MTNPTPAQVTHVETERVIVRIQRIKPLLSAAGVEIPVDFNDAVNLAKVIPDAEAFHNVYGAQRRLSTASTREELNAAAKELAEAEAIRQATRSEAYIHALDTNRVNMLWGAIGNHSTDWFAQLADKYNAEASTFEAAAELIPDMRNVKAMDLDRRSANAVADAKESAARLNVFYHAYYELGRLAGDFEALHANSDWQDFREIVLLVCQPQTWAHANDAAKALQAQRFGAEVPLAVLMPHIIAPRYGAKLELARHPGVIGDRQNALLGEPAAGLGMYPV